MVQSRGCHRTEGEITIHHYYFGVIGSLRIVAVQRTHANPERFVKQMCAKAVAAAVGSKPMEQNVVFDCIIALHRLHILHFTLVCSSA